MGSSNTTSSSSTTPNSALAGPTADTLLKGVQSIWNKGPQVFNQSLYAPAGATTQGAWNSSLAAANNPTYTAGVNGALATTAQQAAGNSVGLNDPAYAKMRADLGNQVLTDTNASFNNSGLFGSDNNQTAATKGLTDALGSLDYGQYLNGQQQQQQAISDLPGLYADAQQPSATAGAVGAAQDTNAQNILTGNADLFNRQKNGQLGLLQQLLPSLSGASSVGGSTTTQTTPTTPWWQSALGLGLSFL
jgi:hypothetical protein